MSYPLLQWWPGRRLFRESPPGISKILRQPGPTVFSCIARSNSAAAKPLRCLHQISAMIIYYSLLQSSPVWVTVICLLKIYFKKDLSERRKPNNIQVYTIFISQRNSAHEPSSSLTLSRFSLLPARKSQRPPQKLDTLNRNTCPNCSDKKVLRKRVQK